MVRPSRVGIAMPKKMIAAPTSKIVKVWPSSPERADQAGLCNGAFAADDRGNGDHVVRIGGMAHAEKKADSQNGEEAGHGSSCLARVCVA